MVYEANTPDDRRVMLRRSGIGSLDDLFKTIPEELRTKGPLDDPAGLERARADAKRERDAGCRTRVRTRRSASWAAERTIISYRRWSTTWRAGRVLHRLHALPGGGKPGNAAGDV